MRGILMIFSVSVVITTSSLASPRTDIESDSVRDPLINLSASDAVDTNSQKEDKAPSPVTTDGHSINQYQCNAIRVRGRSNGKPAVIRMDWCD